MKKTLLVAIMFAGFVSGGAIAQEKTKKGGEKEVRMEVVNGVKTLTIKSSEKGYPEEQIYTGEAAEKKLAELEAEEVKNKKTIKVKMTEVEGKKQLQVITTENGVESIETFEGEAADAKLKEMESSESPKRKKVNIIEPKEKPIEKVDY